MIKEQSKKINKNSPFKFNVAKAISKSKKPKRNKDGVIILSKEEQSKLGHYDRG